MMLFVCCRVSFSISDGTSPSLPVYAHLTVAGDNDNSPELTVVPANKVPDTCSMDG